MSDDDTNCCSALGRPVGLSCHALLRWVDVLASEIVQRDDRAETDVLVVVHHRTLSNGHRRGEQSDLFGRLCDGDDRRERQWNLCHLGSRSERHASGRTDRVEFPDGCGTGSRVSEHHLGLVDRVDGHLEFGHVHQSARSNQFVTVHLDANAHHHSDETTANDSNSSLRSRRRSRSMPMGEEERLLRLDNRRRMRFGLPTHSQHESDFQFEQLFVVDPREHDRTLRRRAAARGFFSVEPERLGVEFGAAAVHHSHRRHDVFVAENHRSTARRIDDANPREHGFFHFDRRAARPAGRSGSIVFLTITSPSGIFSLTNPVGFNVSDYYTRFTWLALDRRRRNDPDVLHDGDRHAAVQFRSVLSELRNHRSNNLDFDFNDLVFDDHDDLDVERFGAFSSSDFRSRNSVVSPPESVNGVSLLSQMVRTILLVRLSLSSVSSTFSLF